MRTTLLTAIIAVVLGGSQVYAQTPLSAYADPGGFIDMHKLTCAQLTSTNPADAEAVTVWYNGWYDGLTHKHLLDYRKGHVVEQEVIDYCKEHPEIRVIDAFAVIYKDERAALGVAMTRPIRTERQATAPAPRQAQAQAQAQTGTIHLNVASAGFIVGAGGGDGTLTFNGEVYPITVGGIGIGVIGFAGGQVDGVAYNMRNPSDIAGTYGAAGAGFTIIGGAQVAQLQNANGVIIQAHGVQIGLEVNLDLAGMTIAMR
jgi:HdeA/HdeB family